MKVTNNRPTNAWFHYSVVGMPKKVSVGAYKSIVLNDLSDINQVKSGYVITNFSQSVVPTDSILTASTTNTTIIEASVQTVENTGAISVNKQTDKKWEIEW